MIEVGLALLIWRWFDPLGEHAPNWVPAVLAQAPSPLPSPGVWEQYGPAGLSAGIFASIAWVLFNMQRETLRIERERSARFEQQVVELNKAMQDKTVPALVQATAAITEAMRALRKDDQR